MNSRAKDDADRGNTLGEAAPASIGASTGAAKADSDKPERPVGRPEGKAGAMMYRNGESLALVTAGGKSSKGQVALTKTWYSPDVGTFVDFPLAGSPQARMVLGSYISYALVRTANKVYQIYSYGSYNPRMHKDGVNLFEVSSPIEPDGAASRVRLSMCIKGNKVGQVLGSFLAKSCFAPPAGDLSRPALAPLGKNPDYLMWAAKQYVGMIKGADFCFMMVGGRKQSVKKVVEEKFKSTFGKRFSDPSISGGVAPKDIVLHPECAAISYKVPSGAALVAMSHPLSGYGTVWIAGNKVGVSVPPEEQKHAEREIRKMLKNGNRVASTIMWYSRVAARDKIGDLGSALAGAAVSIGLPIEIGKKMLGVKTVSIEKIADDIEKSL